MDPRDREEIQARYADRLRQHGERREALASGPVERQRTRFEALLGVGELAGKSVLDLGCGLGELYRFLGERGVEVDYTGYDISPELIEAAARRYPEASFEVRDIQESGIPGEFDYIVSSQTFNQRLTHGDNQALVEDVLRRCFARARAGVAFDFLTSYVDFREDHLYYYEPERLFAFGKSLTRRVVLRHDYPLFEFMLYLYPSFSGWGGGA